MPKHASARAKGLSHPPGLRTSRYFTPSMSTKTEATASLGEAQHTPRPERVVPISRAASRTSKQARAKRKHEDCSILNYSHQPTSEIPSPGVLMAASSVHLLARRKRRRATAKPCPGPVLKMHTTLSKYFLRLEPTDVNIGKRLPSGSELEHRSFLDTMQDPPPRPSSSLALTCQPFTTFDANCPGPPVDPYSPATWQQWGTTTNERLAQDRFYYATALTNPGLIQEKLQDNPWRLLVASMLVNKTSGRFAIPVFWDLVSQWPDPESLSKANKEDVSRMIHRLGLSNIRAERLIAFSKLYIEDPPCQEKLRPSRNYEVPTAISHLPGCGPYALDSYRIFCCNNDEWKKVTPTDKKLVRYLSWKWATTRGVRWDPVHGVQGLMQVEDWHRVGIIL